MKDLPVELMQKIFLETCPPRTTFPLHRDQPRLSVTHVCSLWRAIALSTPTLWAGFDIHPAEVDPIQYTSILSTWTSRADQSTLSFKFYGPYPQFKISITCSIVVEVVFPVIHRCSFLHLYLDISTMHRLLTLPPGSLRALQSLTIKLRGRTLEVGPTPFSTAFGSCPQLHTFALTTSETVEYPPMHLGIANFNIPWHQLTTLTLRSLSISAYEYLDIIRRCTSLQRCTINRLPPIDDSDRDRIMELFHPPITLPSLHTLRAGFGAFGTARNHRDFFRALCLPRLRKFQPKGWTAHFIFWPFKTFQPVLGDTIQELDLSRFEFPESLPEALALVPNLKILWLGDDARGNPRRMVRPFGDGTVAPHLTTLYLEFVENSQFLLDVLEARAAAARANCDVAALDVMILRRENTSTNPPDEARMVALAEAGMRIHWGVTDTRKICF